MLNWPTLSPNKTPGHIGPEHPTTLKARNNLQQTDPINGRPHQPTPTQCYHHQHGQATSSSASSYSDRSIIQRRPPKKLHWTHYTVPCLQVLVAVCVFVHVCLRKFTKFVFAYCHHPDRLAGRPFDGQSTPRAKSGAVRCCHTFVTFETFTSSFVLLNFCCSSYSTLLLFSCFPFCSNNFLAAVDVADVNVDRGNNTIACNILVTAFHLVSYIL